MISEIRVPRETVNDDVVKVVRWLAREGEVVRPGTPVVEIETSKTVLEVEPPCEGRLHIIHGAAAEVPVGAVLGSVGEEGVQTDVNALPKSLRSDALGAAVPAASGPAFSRKARELLIAHGLQEADFSHLPLVREADVLAAVERQRSGGEISSTLAADNGGRQPLPPGKSRGLFADARRSASDRNRGVLWLVWNYLWRNWLLGNLVRVSPRGVITVLHRWRGVKIGSDCFIDPNAILETAYPENISLGNDVRVTAGAIIMTHIKPPHYLRDHELVPTVLKPVFLSDHSFIGVNAVILPGVTVGKAAVVASGAVVTSDVPPFTMVAGNPAKVIKRFTPPPLEHQP
jgi:acetyltransferase-like isoleucine patch superfamily enzyme